MCWPNSRSEEGVSQQILVIVYYSTDKLVTVDSKEPVEAI